ncbi:Uncharacterised protein [Legionella busanensis]|uniref:Uncharacterized protein n=1 Tax=Legionella busanensis TaxID=190655 RepID=A0A378JN99_9GAMM|nr:hypothetical protein [Legionella busanensis]STX52158.1 Uncharacterised protein [Legionella busanensis]
MLIKKLDNLDFGYSADERFFHLSLTGLFDSVRKAARDAVFGLNLLGGIYARCEHISEMYKSVYPTDSAQIDISIDLKEFDRIILLFRYCNQIGINIHPEDLYTFDNGAMYNYKINESAFGTAKVGFYLAAAKKIADDMKEPLELKDYTLPTNRNFWLQEEITSHAKNEYTAYKEKWTKNLSFFKLHPDNLEAKQKVIKASIDHITTIVVNMVNSHPKNPNYYDTSIGWYYLNNYVHLQDHLKKFPDFLMKNPKYFEEEFSLIRDEDMGKFKLLANKYINLRKQQEDFDSSKQSITEQQSSNYCTLL